MLRFTHTHTRTNVRTHACVYIYIYIYCILGSGRMVDEGSRSGCWFVCHCLATVLHHRCVSYPLWLLDSRWLSRLFTSCSRAKATSRARCISFPFATRLPYLFIAVDSIANKSCGILSINREYARIIVSF